MRACRMCFEKRSSSAANLADEYEKGNRMDLADKERAEAAMLEAYLPAQISAEEIEAEVRSIIAETGSREVSKVMPLAIQRLKGRADGRAVNQVVTKVLAGGLGARGQLDDQTTDS